MKDRYLYKAKTAKIVSAYNNAEDGVWVKGYLRCDTGKWTIYQFEFDRADYVFYEIDPDTICQCTGLKDKNNNLIWENVFWWVILMIIIHKMLHMKWFFGIKVDFVQRNKEVMIF